MIFVDAGSTYAKYYDDIKQERAVINIRDFKQFLKTHSVDVATGHSAKVFKPKLILNELVVLKEAVSVLNTDGKFDSFTAIDVGSRDIKVVKYKDAKFENCDWNTACGAMVGFTVDLLMKYFSVTASDLVYKSKTADVTCGLLGITRLFDELAKGDDIKEGLSMLINGMAKFAYSFSGKPSTLLLSGGMSENHIFVKHLQALIGDRGHFISLGRYSLIDGMQHYVQNNKENLATLNI